MVDEIASVIDGPDEGSHAAAAKRAKKTLPMQSSSLRQQAGFMGDDVLYDGYEPGYILPPNASDGFDSNIIYNSATGDVVFKTPSQRAATKVQATGMAPNALLRIYTDGSSLRNGQKGGFAGVGVYFGPGDVRYGYHQVILGSPSGYS